MLVLALLLSQGGQAQETSGGEAQEQPVVLELEDLKLTAPATWYLAEGQPSTEYELHGLLASDGEGDDQAFILVSVVSKRGRSLDALESMTRNYVIMRMDGIVEYERSKSIAGAPGHVMVYEGMSGGDSPRRRKFMRTVIDKGEFFYIIQGVTSPSAFSRHAGTLENVTNSAQWTQ